MAKQTATITLTNNTNGRALAQLYHKNATDGVQSAAAIIDAGKTATILTVKFRTGPAVGFVPDWWFLVLHVLDGNSGGTYVSGGSSSSSLANPDWKECQLRKADAGQKLAFTATTQSFHIGLKSGSENVAMHRLRDFKPIQNVFVLMLENHSFDNLLAFSGIPNITAATTADTNTYVDSKGVTQTLHVSNGAPQGMSTDPGHEFEDIMDQLCGKGAYDEWNDPNATNKAFPDPLPKDQTAFAANYANPTDGKAKHPADAHVKDILAGFTPTTLPVLQQLAREFAVCDHWYSSLPGPTWPNRFFVHCASSGGRFTSPDTLDMLGWETVHGFKAPHGSIYDKLREGKWTGTKSTQKLSYRFYQDAHWTVGTLAAVGGFTVWSADAADFLIGNREAMSLYASDPLDGWGIPGMGWVPPALALSGIDVLDFHSMADFADDLSVPYDPAYTFIEPHYGNTTMGTFAGGSSQHPKDKVHGGEAMLKAVYEAIRNSPLWYTSLLIVTYDEHGGFYDSVTPPKATPPGDSNTAFDFGRYGVRVPALVISPLVNPQVSSVIYDHSSVPKTLERIFGLSHLTERDRNAYTPYDLCTLSVSKNTVRTNCPTTLNNPPEPLATAVDDELTSPIDVEAVLAQPLPESGNFIGALGVLLKIDASLGDGSEAWKQSRIAEVRALKTRGDAARYAERVWQRIMEHRRKAAGA